MTSETSNFYYSKVAVNGDVPFIYASAFGKDNPIDTAFYDKMAKGEPFDMTYNQIKTAGHVFKDDLTASLLQQKGYKIVDKGDKDDHFLNPQNKMVAIIAQRKKEKIIV